jgi:hypothetical protein
LGAFAPLTPLCSAAFTDGLSKTLCAVEVLSYTPYVRNAALPGELPMPVDPTAFPSGGQKKFDPPTGHTEWVDGRAHQTGVTTTFPPNSVVSPAVADGLDIDWTNQQEGKSSTVRTYAAVTARSHHVGIVNAVRMDGSAAQIADDVERRVWQANSTRNGREP